MYFVTPLRLLAQMFTSPQKMLTALLTGRQCIQPRTIQITQQLVAGYVRMCAMDH